MELTLKGVIVKELRRNRYLLATRSKTYVVESKDRLDIGPCKVTVSGSDGTMTVIEHAPIDEYIEPDVEIRSLDPLLSNPVLSKMMQDVRRTAERIKRAVFMGRDVLIRFHNDTDGITSALLIYMALKKPVHNMQNNSVIYSPSEALRDLSLMTGYRPLVLILDLGSDPHCDEGIKLLLGAGAEVIVVDHHPPNHHIDSVSYLNPWDYGGDSNITTGVLAAELSRALGLDDETARKLMNYSLTGDKSDLYTPTDEDIATSVVLDYIGVYSSFPNTLEFYKRVLFDDRALFESIRVEAYEKIEEIRSNLEKYMSMREVVRNGTDIRVYLLRLDKLVKRFGFPSKSKACGIAFEEIGDSYNGPYVVIGYGKRLITVRVNSEAYRLGVSARRIISDLMTDLGDVIISGGGHDKAASLRTDNVELVLSEFIKRVGATD
ncbi:hypothetical protein J7K41_00535 [Candidatus Micrarchaeota archaeon]|nr:hypothetical protein [Candidatus Micrarchaeota archaeon]